MGYIDEFTEDVEHNDNYTLNDLGLDDDLLNEVHKIIEESSDKIKVLIDKALQKRANELNIPYDKLVKVERNYDLKSNDIIHFHLNAFGDGPDAPYDNISLDVTFDMAKLVYEMLKEN